MIFEVVRTISVWLIRPIQYGNWIQKRSFTSQAVPDYSAFLISANRVPRIRSLMSRLIALLVVVFVSATLIGCPARSRLLNQPEIIIAEGAYSHEKSRMTFPLAVGEYRRVGIQRYDKEGLDISASYNLEDGRRQIVATVYVYPTLLLASIESPPETRASARSHLSKQEFELRKREVLQSRPGARLIEDTEIMVPLGGTIRTGRMATFEYDEKFAGKHQALRSHLCVFNFVGGKWALKYRITYPKNQESTREIGTLMEGVPWNVPQD